MKAEHRKELQTNALADRMGRMVQRMKSKPDRRSVLWIVLAIGFAIVLIAFVFYRNNQRNTLSANWVDFAEGRLFGITRDNKIARMPLLSDYSTTKPGVAARFQLAWTFLWDRGLKFLGANPNIALENIAQAEKSFAQLAEECKDDPVLVPEAEYALAVIEESRAVMDREFLDKAISRYKAVESKHKESAAGKAAGQRARYLADNRGPVEEFYVFMQQNTALFRSLEKMQQEQPPPKEPEKLPEKDKQ
jgi:hypothetical protein